MAEDDGSSTFKVEYAKSGRSTCYRCRQTIAEKELRIGPLVQSDKGDFKYPQFHHFHCFEDGWLKKHPGALHDIQQVSGVDALQFADQKRLKGLVVAGDSSAETKAVSAEEKRVAQDSKLVWNFREKLDSNLSDAELKVLLEHNGQPHSGKVFGGRAKMLDRAADGMAFGALPKCSVCTTGDYYLSHGEYRCFGAMDEFAKCENRQRDVDRSPFRIPKELAEDYDFLAKFKFKPRDRAGTAIQGAAVVVAGKAGTDDASAAISSAAEVDGGGAGGGEGRPSKRERELPVAASVEHLAPFQGCVVMFAGKLSKTQAQLEALITSNGGSVSKTPSGATVCVCTPEEAVSGKATKRAQEALAAGVLFVSEDWVTSSIAAGHRLDKADTAPFVLANPVKADASRDVLKLLGDKVEVEQTAREQRALLEEKYSEAPPSKVAKRGSDSTVKKVVVKGAAAVEQESGLVEVGHIYEPKKGEVFNCVLNMTDVTTGKNSFYILQLIEHDTKKKWSVFRKWGRIGDDSIGGTKLTDYPLPEPALREFKKVFLDKTGNEWEQRHPGQFKKVYGKFLPIEVDYSTSVPSPAEVGAGGASLSSATEAGYQGPLPKSTQDFISLIFDIQAMNDALKELEIDTRKLPLGKLSKATLTEGWAALKELQQVIESLSKDSAIPSATSDTATSTSSGPSPPSVGSSSPMPPAIRAKIVSLTNKFYSYIPHEIGKDGNGQLLDTLEKVRAKCELVAALQDMEISSKLLSQSGAVGEHPIDVHYRKLNASLTPVERGSEEFCRIRDYIQNTHGKTHTAYRLELVDLWTVEREGEATRFAPHADNPNRMLLWHGSRLTNWGGILSQGLRIAPPEAPSTGYMFGKGVYFADMCSKSANYCFTTSEKTTGVMMLCEVALGEMKKLKKAEYVERLTKPFQSTMGVGQYKPDPAGQYREPSGCVVPMGKGISAGVPDTTLLYNEFIVYDVAQVKTRYVMRMNFIYAKKAGTFF